MYTIKPTNESAKLIDNLAAESGETRNASANQLIRDGALRRACFVECLKLKSELAASMRVIQSQQASIETLLRENTTQKEDE